MPRRLALSTLVTRCKQRADQENSSHVSDSEWKALISEQYGELHQAVAGAGLRYFESSSTVSTTGATSYTEPSDHLATVRIDRLYSDGTRYELEPLEVAEESYLAGITGDARFYSLVDDQLYLWPNPPSGQTYVWRYIAQATDLSGSADATLVDLVTADGEAFLIWGVAVKALSKSESDVRLAMAERDQAKARLVEWASLRAFNSARRRIVKDELSFDELDPASWWNRS